MYCHICGKELPAQAKTCPECSMAVPEKRENRKNATKTEVYKETQANNGMVCPQCGSETLQALNEVNTNTTTTGSGYSASQGCCGYIMFGPLGLLCGACNSGPKTTTTTTNTMHFVCSKCGHKFRKPVDLREDAEKIKNNSIASLIAMIAAAILIIIIVAVIGGGETGYVVGGIIVGIIMIIVGAVLTAKSYDQASELLEEAERIEQKIKKYK